MEDMGESIQSQMGMTASLDAVRRFSLDMSLNVAYLMPHASGRMPHASYLMPHASCRMPYVSYLMPHASCLMPHASCLMPQAMPHALCLASLLYSLSMLALRLTPAFNHIQISVDWVDSTGSVFVF